MFPVIARRDRAEAIHAAARFWIASPSARNDDA
jgi:hypothetical protein